MPDQSQELRAAVLNAIEQARPLSIQGGGSKAFYGRESSGEAFPVCAHSGILNYEPTELVLSARCGTRLTEVEAALAEKGQMLGFEPPHFSSESTLGGVVASGLSGPRRPFAGSVRDFVLGCRMLNGRAEILRFGGEVMKNVAGYDMPRLLSGSLGTLAVILDISLKVIPRPESELTLVQEMSEQEAIEKMNQWQGRALPISGLSWYRGLTSIRLSGGMRTVNAARTVLGGESLDNGASFWTGLRDQSAGFFSQVGALWRLSIEAATPRIEVDADWLYEWGGAQRWCVIQDPDVTLFETAARWGGHATRYRCARQRDIVFQPLPEPLARLHRGLKQAFDPHRILNPGRMYSGW